jgi:hypothetical protein
MLVAVVLIHEGLAGLIHVGANNGFTKLIL